MIKKNYHKKSNILSMDPPKSLPNFKWILTCSEKKLIFQLSVLGKYAIYIQINASKT